MHIFAKNHTFRYFKTVRSIALVGLIVCAFLWPGGSLFFNSPHPADKSTNRTLEQKITKYYIYASAPVLGKLASVGFLSFEETLQRNEENLEKVLYLHGNTKPEMVAKGRDFGGEFKITKRVPLESSGIVGPEVLEQSKDAEIFYAGTLKQKERVESETVIFYPDYVLATREDGVEKRIDGKYESPLGALEYLLENDIKVGDTYESKFILSGYPYIFKCEVSKKEQFKQYGVSVFKIDITTYDGLKKDKSGKPLVKKKKGGIRIWLCKEGKYKNRILRLNIKYKWYITLNCEVKMVA